MTRRLIFGHWDVYFSNYWTKKFVKQGGMIAIGRKPWREYVYHVFSLFVQQIHSDNTIVLLLLYCILFRQFNDPNWKPILKQMIQINPKDRIPAAELVKLLQRFFPVRLFCKKQHLLVSNCGRVLEWKIEGTGRSLVSSMISYHSSLLILSPFLI